jgi:hypothetical protein
MLGRSAYFADMVRKMPPPVGRPRNPTLDRMIVRRRAETADYMRNPLAAPRAAPCRGIESKESTGLSAAYEIMAKR